MKGWIVEGRWEVQWAETEDVSEGRHGRGRENQEESRFGASVRYVKTLERVEAKEEEEDIEWMTDVERSTTPQEEGSDMGPA